MVCENPVVSIALYFTGRLADPWRLDEALRAITAFCEERDWIAEEWSQRVSGVALVTAAELYGESKRPREPWPAASGGSGAGDQSLRARVRRKYPPPRLEETNRGLEVTIPGLARVLIAFTPAGHLAEYYEMDRAFVIDAIPNTAHWIASMLGVTAGSVAAHAGICELLAMLQSRFVPDLSVEDPTDYWATGDVRTLLQEYGL